MLGAHKNATAKGGECKFGAAGGGQTWRRRCSSYSVSSSLMRMQPLTQPFEIAAGHVLSILVAAIQATQ